MSELLPPIPSFISYVLCVLDGGVVITGGDCRVGFLSGSGSPVSHRITLLKNFIKHLLSTY